MMCAERHPASSAAPSLFHWFGDRESFARHAVALEPMRKVVDEYLSSVDAVTGYCVACNRVGELRNPKPPRGTWINLRDSLTCACGLNGRMRMMYRALADVLGAVPPTRALVFERITPFFAAAHERFPTLEGCEYVSPTASPGSLHAWHGVEVRHEDMLALSHGDASLGLVCHADVLEHVPDPRKALAECARVLAPGGTLLFTCPFFDLDRHIVRADVVDGALRHLLPPGYHGNPMSAQGSLVFTHFGWPLLDDVRDAGFSRVEIGLLYDPWQGIVSNNNPYPDGFMWPVLFRAVR
jgi:SAM-dependent methyltransferase